MLYEMLGRKIYISGKVVATGWGQDRFGCKQMQLSFWDDDILKL